MTTPTYLPRSRGIPSDDPTLCRWCRLPGVVTYPGQTFVGICAPCNEIGLTDLCICESDDAEDRPRHLERTSLTNVLRGIAERGGNWRRVVAMNTSAFPGEATEDETAELDALTPWAKLRAQRDEAMSMARATLAADGDGPRWRSSAKQWAACHVRSAMVLNRYALKLARAVRS